MVSRSPADEISAEAGSGVLLLHPMQRSITPPKMADHERVLTWVKEPLGLRQWHQAPLERRYHPGGCLVLHRHRFPRSLLR